jgi:hypothetical protein
MARVASGLARRPRAVPDPSRISLERRDGRLEICAEPLHEIAVNSGRPYDEADALVRRFAKAYDPNGVASLQEHLQRELGKLKPSAASKVVGRGRSRLKGAWPVSLRPLSKPYGNNGRAPPTGGARQESAYYGRRIAIARFGGRRLEDSVGWRNFWWNRRTNRLLSLDSDVD